MGYLSSGVGVALNSHCDKHTASTVPFVASSITVDGKEQDLSTFDINEVHGTVCVRKHADMWNPDNDEASKEVETFDVVGDHNDPNNQLEDLVEALNLSSEVWESEHQLTPTLKLRFGTFAVCNVGVHMLSTDYSTSYDDVSVEDMAAFCAWVHAMQGKGRIALDAPISLCNNCCS